MPRDQITNEAIMRRKYWVSEIVTISGNFGQDYKKIEQELELEISANGQSALLDHIRLCGAIPEFYGHDTSEEKLYSKYTDAVLAVAFRAIGLKSVVLTERADAADVEVIANGYSFVADAKAFRLSRTAKNQKDFKVQAMDGWRRDKKYAVVVSPLYQMPSRTSQIYQQAITRDVCLLSYSHLAVLLNVSQVHGPDKAQAILRKVFECVSTMTPTKQAIDYWTLLNRAFLDGGDFVLDLWRNEKIANLEAIKCSKEEALVYLSQEREAILRLNHDEAIKRLITTSKIDSRMGVIKGISDNKLLDASMG